MKRFGFWAATAGLALVGLGCPGPAREVVYDLAARSAVADHQAEVDVVLFGAPSARPRLASGFHLEGASGAVEPGAAALEAGARRKWGCWRRGGPLEPRAV